ncbi:MAG TPA: DUF2637 domain-containing protein [Pseudonocardiaceae bacterium]|nr:DUF2637 domain-containing protein [Pseudonocardiaceae bacterium]
MNGQRTLLAEHWSTTEGRGQRLNRGQLAAVTMAVALALVVAGYGLAGSYVTVSALAARRGVPLAGLVPAGIDGGVLAVVTMDLALAWVGMPVAWLRQLVRVLAVGTIAANITGGWPDPVAGALHSAAPAMLLAVIEAGRTVLLRRIGQARGTHREAIPLARWLLAPWRTCRLWRRMILWQVISYRQAIDTELELRRAIALLRMRHGRYWRRRAPADLVWMLCAGVHVDEACARIRAAMEIEDPSPAGPMTASMRAGTNPLHATVRHDRARAASASPSTTTSGVESQVLASGVDRDRFAEAVRLNREHWVRTGRPISAETLRKRLRLGSARSRAICRAVRAVDRAVVCGTDLAA